MIDADEARRRGLGAARGMAVCGPYVLAFWGAAIALAALLA